MSGRIALPDWLGDIHASLVIEGPLWRARARELKALPHWSVKPSRNVRAYFRVVDEAGVQPPSIPEDLAAEVKEHYERDLVAFLWYGTSIRDRDTRRRQKPVWQPGQIAIMWRVALTVRADLPVRLDLLKQRQGGFSTLFANIEYWIAGFHENIGALQAAQDKDTTRQLHSYVKEVYEMQPAWLRPPKRYSSRLELDLTEPDEERRLDGERGLESSITAQTAGKDFLGTGLPLQALHVSEIGKWHQVCAVEPTYTSVVNAIQDLPFTFIFRESTAHGADTYWHREWKASMRIGLPGWNGHVPVFCPWYLDDRNRRPAPPHMALEEEEHGEFGNEVALTRDYDLDNDQLMWRRGAIRKQPSGVRPKKELFKQEHPASEAEAWLFAGGKFVGAEVIQAMKADAYLRPAIIWQGVIEHRREDGIDLSWKRWSHKRASGPFTVWKWPSPEYEHLISADVSEGLSDGDMSCAKVWRRYADRLVQVAEWWGTVPTDEFAQLLWRLGWFYRCRSHVGSLPALLAWERTGPGSGIHGWLRSGNLKDPTDSYPSGRMFRMMRHGRAKTTREMVFGVSTSKHNKRLLLDMWLEWARDGRIDSLVPDVLEADSLELDDRGGVDTGGRDRMMASVIGVYAHRSSQMLVFPPDATKKQSAAWGTVAWADEIEKEGKERRAREIGEVDVLYTAPLGD